MSSNPYLFVVGCPRSGTTLLQRMLDHHQQLAVTKDTHFIKSGLEGEGTAPNPEMTPWLLERVIGYRRFFLMGLDPSRVREIGRAASTYREFVSRLYDE